MSFWIVWVTLLPYAFSLDENSLKHLTSRPDLPDFASVLAKLKQSQPDSLCCRDLERYVSSTGKEDWATKMYDSMEKIPFGLHHGRFVYMGSFDECIRAVAVDFTGKYCLVDIVFDSSEPTLGNSLSYGVCIPSTCTGSDVEATLGNFGVSDANVTIQAKDKHCSTNDPVVLSTEDWIVIGFFCSIGLIVLSSTGFDVMHQYNASKAKRYDLYSSFSLCKNGRKLFETYNGPGNVGCLHGVRSLTLCWVILCHEYLFSLYTPMLNASDIYPEYIGNKNRIPILNGFVAVDTFFLLSGLLVTFVFFRDVSKTGSYDVPVAVLHRYLRVTPAFAMMMLIQSTVMLKAGRGPMWSKVMGPAVDTCRESWWSGLIYLQNFFKPHSICLDQSWYLSSDMQMFWLSPLLLYPLLFWPKKGFFIILGALITSLTVSFVMSVLTKFGPNFIITKSDNQFVAEYIQTYMRLTPYIVGIGLGYILSGVKANKIKVDISKWWIAIGWLLSFGLCLCSTHGLLYFIDTDYWNQFILSSIYLTFHRLGWSLGVGWIIFACCAGWGGPVNRLLSWKGFQVIGKLSFCMFLVHQSVQLYQHGTRQTNFYIHDVYLVSNYFGTIALSIVPSLILYLFVEAPVSNLDRYFSRDLKLFPLPNPRCGETENVAGNQLLPSAKC